MQGDSKDSLAQLEASKLSIEGFFKDLLNKMEGFKYQITMTVLLCKYKTKWRHRVCSCLF